MECFSINVFLTKLLSLKGKIAISADDPVLRTLGFMTITEALQPDSERFWMKLTKFKDCQVGEPIDKDVAARFGLDPIGIWEHLKTPEGRRKLAELAR